MKRSVFAFALTSVGLLIGAAAFAQTHSQPIQSNYFGTVVATEVGGVGESVVDGHTGVLVHPGDVAALTAALELLLEDARLRRRLGDAGRARACELFDLPRFRAAHLELYQRELGRPQRLGKTWRIGYEASA